MKIHTKRHILHITLHKILRQYVTLSPVSCYLLLYIYSNSNVLAEADTRLRHPSRQNTRSKRINLVLCQGEGKDMAATGKGEKIKQGLKQKVGADVLAANPLRAIHGGRRSRRKKADSISSATQHRRPICNSRTVKP